MSVKENKSGYTAETDSYYKHSKEVDPYFAVIPYEKYKKDNLSDAALSEFFESGEAHIEKIWTLIEDNFVKDFRPVNSIDFGCGVGRLTLPIARRGKTVIGIDISENMLAEARRNAEKFDLENTTFVKGDETLSMVSGKFDFVHSYIVFQHIKPRIGEMIFKRLVEMLNVGGIGVLHLTYHNSNFSTAQKVRFSLYRDFPFTFKIRNFALGKKHDALFPMYNYDLNRIFLILQENDCHKCFVKFSQHGIEGAILFFQKKKEVLY